MWSKEDIVVGAGFTQPNKLRKGANIVYVARRRQTQIMFKIRQAAGAPECVKSVEKKLGNIWYLMF
jgi:hypothetical protein